MIDELRDALIRSQSGLKKSKQQEAGLNTDWVGTRQEVELPLNDGDDSLHPKDIVPELLNRPLLWTESYHHYEDWKKKMEEVYDQFNLL